MFTKKSNKKVSGVSSKGNPAVAKHIKKQHVAHNKGMQSSPSMTGASPASSQPVMPNPYVSH